MSQQRILTGGSQPHTHNANPHPNANGDPHHDESRKRVYEFDSMANFHVSANNNVINMGQSNMSSISSINSRINSVAPHQQNVCFYFYYFFWEVLLLR
jgi:hypothetical protein